MHPLIQKSLGIRSETWPPDYYTLLGLASQATSPEVESAVLSRMERLRAYQLAHPEPVTEAMNLLARALVVLSDPKSRAEYDLMLAPPDTQAVPTPLPTSRHDGIRKVEHEHDVGNTAIPAPPTPGPERQPTVVEEKQKPPPQIIEPPKQQRYLVVGESQLVPPPLPLSDAAWLSPDDPDYLGLVPLERRRNEVAGRTVRPPTADERRRPSEWRARRSSIHSNTPLLTRNQRERKRIQTRWLVRMRKLLRAWDEAGSLLAAPRATLASRAQYVGVIKALRNVAAEGGHAISDRGPGSQVLDLALDGATVTGLSELSTNDRDALADDWRSGRALILQNYWSAREMVGRHSRMAHCRRAMYRLQRYTPEMAWAALAFVSIILAIIRSS